MPIKPSKTKKSPNRDKHKSNAMRKSGDIAQTVKQPEAKQPLPLPQVQEKKKQSAEEMIVELLQGDAKYTRKLLKLKIMGSGVDFSTFGRAIDLLESTMKIVYVPPEVISIQEKDNAVVRLKKRVIPSKRTPI